MCHIPYKKGPTHKRLVLTNLFITIKSLIYTSSDISNDIKSGSNKSSFWKIGFRSKVLEFLHNHVDHVPIHEGVNEDASRSVIPWCAFVDTLDKVPNEYLGILTRGLDLGPINWPTTHHLKVHIAQVIVFLT